MIRAPSAWIFKSNKLILPYQPAPWLTCRYCQLIMLLAKSIITLIWYSIIMIWSCRSTPIQHLHIKSNIGHSAKSTRPCVGERLKAIAQYLVLYMYIQIKVDNPFCNFVNSINLETGECITFHPRFSKNVLNLIWPVVFPPQGPTNKKQLMSATI